MWKNLRYALLVFALLCFNFFVSRFSLFIYELFLPDKYINLFFLAQYYPRTFLSFLAKSREVFERAVEFYGEENMDEKLFVSFARFEESCKEVACIFYSPTKTYSKLFLLPGGLVYENSSFVPKIRDLKNFLRQIIFT